MKRAISIRDPVTNKQEFKEFQKRTERAIRFLTQNGCDESIAELIVLIRIEDFLTRKVNNGACFFLMERVDRLQKIPKLWIEKIKEPAIFQPLDYILFDRKPQPDEKGEVDEHYRIK